MGHPFFALKSDNPTIMSDGVKFFLIYYIKAQIGRVAIW